MSATLATPVWLTTEDAASRISRPAQFVRRAAEAGELHGHQRTGADGRPLPKSRWSFAAAALDAYVRNGGQTAQRAACGCADDSPTSGAGDAA